MAMTTSSPVSDTNDKDAAFKREKVRNRINQRAFRSRRQEYVRELEEQVQKFQREGVRATQEVQMAARSVASENALLRKFVKVYAKCDDHDIDMLLVHMRDESSDLPSSLNSRNGNAQCRTEQDAACGLKALPCQATSNRQTSSLPAKPLGPVITAAKVPQNVQDSATSTHPPHLLQDKQAVPQPTPRQTEEYSLPTPAVAEFRVMDLEDSAEQIDYQRGSTSSKGPGDSISCEEAATIIAGLRMRNAEDAREELGCQSQDSCHIKNIALLQLMNETF